jgi:hypothetical protein
MKAIKWIVVAVFLLVQIWIACSLHSIAHYGVDVWGQIDARQSGSWYISR